MSGGVLRIRFFCEGEGVIPLFSLKGFEDMINSLDPLTILTPCHHSSSNHLRPRRILQPPKARNILPTAIPRNLLPLLSLLPHNAHTLIPLLLLLPNPLKQLMPLKMPHHPVMQILHIGNRIHNPPRPQHIRILAIQRIRHDSRLVFPLLEMWIREAEEYFLELAFGEEVGEEFHAVGAEAGYVLVVWAGGWGGGAVLKP